MRGQVVAHPAPPNHSGRYTVSEKETNRPPLACTAIWLAVMKTAGGMCQCTGACGTKHRNGRDVPCTVEHDELGRHGRVRLIAAPEDASLSVLRAAALPAERLRAWCPPCWSAMATQARRAAREAASVPQAEALF